MSPRILTLWLFVACCFAALVPAHGVIAVSLTMADLYEQSGQIIIGNVTEADVQVRVVKFEALERPKGGPAGDVIALRFEEGVELPPTRVGEPAILFAGRKSSVIHLADGWFMAKGADADTATWRVTKNQGPTVDFPGRTQALVRVIADIKAGKRTLVYGIEHNVFKGGVRKLADVAPHPKAIASEDVNGDGWKDVLVVGAERSQLFLNHNGDLTEAPGEISKACGLWAAAGWIDGDGLPDFLVGDTIWLHNGKGFTAGPRLAPMPEGKVVAAGIFDADCDGRADVLLATESGETIIFKNPGTPKGRWTPESKQLWTGGAPVLAAALSNCWGDNGKPHLLVIREAGPTRYALDADGGPPAEHVRLAGYPPSWGGPWKILGGCVLDVDGNGLPDFYGSGEDFGAILNSRGFGTFLSNYSAKHVHGHPGAPWGELTRETVLGSCDLNCDRCDDLLIATEDGRFFEVNNRNVKAEY